MAISKDFLWDTIGQLACELEKVDPQSILAAKTQGLLTARALGLHTTDRHAAPKRRVHDDRIAELYLTGKSTWGIATELGINAGTVSATLRRLGIEIRSRGEASKAAYAERGKPRIERIRQMRAEGKTLEEVGAAEKITRERVRQICLKAGINVERGLTPEQKQAVSEYVAGESLEQVAARHKTNPSTARGWILKEGFSIRPSPKTSKRDPETLKRAEKAAELYHNGKTINEISQAVGYGDSGGGPVYRLLAIAGVKPNRGSFGFHAEQSA